MPPALSPIAPPTPSPTPTASPAKTGAPPDTHANDHLADWMQESSADLDALDRGEALPDRPRAGAPAPPKPPEKKKTAEKPKVEDPKKAESGDPLDEEGIVPKEEETPPKPPEKPVDQPKPTKAAELRQAYEASQARLKELEPEVTRLNARIKELETTPKTDPEAENRFKALEARNKQLSEALAALDIQQDDNFKKEHVVPLNEAMEAARADIKGAEIEDSDGKGGYMMREANDADLFYLAGLPSLKKLTEEANRMFGDLGPTVVNHVRTINRLYQGQVKAIEEAKANSKITLETRQREQIARQAKRAELWGSANKALAEKHPKWFAPVEGDKDGNSLLEAGMALTDAMFNSGALTPERIELLPKSFREELKANGRLSDASEVRLHAIVRNKAANHDRLAQRMAKLRTELAEAKAALEAYQDSEPPGGGGTPRNSDPGSGHWSDDPNAELDEIDRQSR